MQLTPSIRWLIILASLHSGLLVTANAAGAKLIAVGSLTASATVFIYTASFLITDIVSEIYGKKIANIFVWVGFGASLMSVGAFQVAIYAPSSVLFQSQDAYETVFQITGRLLLGGFTSYIVSQFVDVQIFHTLKKLTEGKHLWLRNNVSTLVAQLIDTLIFIFIGFYGLVPEIQNLILGQYLIKVAIALLDTPIAYIVIRHLRKNINIQNNYDY